MSPDGFHFVQTAVFPSHAFIVAFVVSLVVFGGLIFINWYFDLDNCLDNRDVCGRELIPIHNLYHAIKTNTLKVNTRKLNIRL